MKEIKKEYPYVDVNGVEHKDKIKYYYPGYKIMQVETGDVYDEAIDLYPSNYTYVVTEEKIEETEEAKNNEEN